MRPPPELPALFLLALSATLLSAGPVRVRGQTEGGMAFEGIALHAEGGQLALRTGPDARPVELAIPLSTIRRLTLHQQPSTNNQSPIPNNQLESMPALLPLWDAPSLRLLLEQAEEAATRGDWAGAWHWAGRLEAVLEDPAERRRATLLKAWALEEMRLFPALDAVLGELAESIAPLEAPPRLCWLMAARARRAGDREGALYWAHLPALQIPAASGPLRTALADWIHELENPHANRRTP